ncbi:hypothetical protein CBOM_07579 [Ceraceosorus bombacis]|uniref:Uncharacterized protein n=1 Tax=Ceraceosorus bombacis TaxID=401625 RepID=A0A0P1BGP6_9BASI|nr:hypothetical protein CBOM_07579 [Ceraceosorus bombacis]
MQSIQISSRYSGFCAALRQPNKRRTRRESKDHPVTRCSVRTSNGSQKLASSALACPTRIKQPHELHAREIKPQVDTFARIMS